jgi:hypothetical protein
VPLRGLRVPIGLLGLEGNEQERGDRHGEVKTMAGTAARRHDVSGPWPGGDLAQVVGSCPRGVRGRMRVLKGTGTGTGGERAHGCAAARRTDTERLGGAAGVASAYDGPRM